jgi:peptidoglycan/xylan/chitin deacetylase (PgdA/CDA1 family)
MARRTVRANAIKPITHFNWNILLVCLAIVMTLFVMEGFKAKEEHKSTVETIESEVKKLPKKVKKAIAYKPVNAAYNVPILMYHYVENVKDTRDTFRQSLNISPDIFEEQLKTLVGAGYTFLTASELGEVIDGQRELPEKPVLLTFDDGHWDILSDVVPLLKQYRAKGTVYIITDFLNGSDFLSESELREVIKSGVFEIGAHTVHHVSLPGKMPETVKYEVEESKNYLEGKFNIWVNAFAYPNGALDLQSLKVVREAGFTTAVSTVPGVEVTSANRLALYRLRPGRRTGEALLDYLSQSDAAYR